MEIYELIWQEKNSKKQNQNKNPNLVPKGSGNYDAQVLTSMYTS